MNRHEATQPLDEEPGLGGLCKTLYQQLATTVSDVDFYAAVEHGTDDDPPRSEVALLFDVPLTDPGQVTQPVVRPPCPASAPATATEPTLAGKGRSAA